MIWTANPEINGTGTFRIMSEKQFDFLRRLSEQAANDIPGGYVDDDTDELIDIGYVTVLVVGNLFSYEITDDGRAALKRCERGA
jgi:hypothetical protein